MALADGHAVDDPDGSLIGDELRLEHQGVPPVVAVGGQARSLGGDPPRPVVLVTQELGKARTGIESRQAEPVDRSVPSDQGDGVQIADDSVVLDGKRHDSVLVRAALGGGLGCGTAGVRSQAGVQRPVPTG